jgi:hypothetical protein
VNGKLEQLRLCIALGAAAELQCDDRHSTISRRGRGRLRQTRQRTQPAARQGRADKFFTAPPNRRRTSWATFRLQTRLRKSGRRVVRGGVRCSPAVTGAPERVSPQGLPPLADRSTAPSDHSAQHPADCTQMRATRRIPGEAKGGRLPLGHRSRTTGAPPYPRIGSPFAPTRTTPRIVRGYVSHHELPSWQNIFSKTVVVFVCQYRQHRGYSTK